MQEGKLVTFRSRTYGFPFANHFNRRFFSTYDLDMQNKEDIVKQILPLVKEWKLEKLKISNAKFSFFLAQMPSIEFPSLKIVSFYEAKIESVQILCRIWLPSLEEMWLGQNSIASMRTMKKGNWPNLSTISLYQNKISELKIFVELKSKMEYLNVECDKNDDEQCCDMGWVAKMQKTQRLKIEQKYEIKKGLDKNLSWRKIENDDMSKNQ